MTIDIKYENYSIKDFLEDDLFLQWQLAPTETLDEFWKQVLQQYPPRKPIFPTLSGPCIQ